MKHKVIGEGQFNVKYELVKKFFYKTGIKVADYKKREDLEIDFKPLKIYHV